MVYVTPPATRDSGLDPVGHVPWGTHLCQFYETEQDLLEILVPYFAAGLRSNERCMWVTSEPVPAEMCLAALAEAVPDVEAYLDSGQLSILAHTDWYLRDGYFDVDRTLGAWREQHDLALASGYDGLRVTGNTAWLEDKDWADFAEYEKAIDAAFGDFRMLAV